MNVAWIGLGNMGGPMAANLIKAGHKVTGFDLVKASCDAAKADGRWDAAYAPMRAALDEHFPNDLREAIEASPRARKTFRSLGRCMWRISIIGSSAITKCR